MSCYLLFVITQYDAVGGWGDFYKAVGSIEEAEELLKTTDRTLDFAHLVDLETLQITVKWINASFYPSPPHWVRQ